MDQYRHIIIIEQISVIIIVFKATPNLSLLCQTHAVFQKLRILRPRRSCKMLALSWHAVSCIFPPLCILSTILSHKIAYLLNYALSNNITSNTTVKSHILMVLHFWCNGDVRHALLTPSCFIKFISLIINNVFSKAII